MVIDVKPLQLEKAVAPILVTLLGIVIEVKDEQSEKAVASMLVTLLGIVTEVKDLQLMKALYPMLVTLLGIVYAPCLPPGYATSVVLSLLNNTPSTEL